MNEKQYSRPIIYKLDEHGEEAGRGERKKGKVAMVKKDEETSNSRGRDLELEDVPLVECIYTHAR